MHPAEARPSFENDVPVLEARAVSKSFAGVVANDRVDFSLLKGEIHAVLGENGAGKSTLASILTGLYHPDGGQILLQGKPVHFKNPGDALACRIGIVHQHFRLVEGFTVTENVVLGDRAQRFFLSRRQDDVVASLGKKFALHVEPSARVADLSMGERQRVEIVKMLYRNVDILFLDEPTAVLTPREVDALCKTLRSMATAGKSIVLITHRLDEVMAVADRATVMRGGRVVGSVRVAETSVGDLTRMMVGQELASRPPQRTRSVGEARLMAERLGLIGWHRGAGEAIDLTVKAGEILGIAGVAGNGQLQLAETLAGLRKPLSGMIRVNGIDVTGRGTRAARDAGLAYVPQDRLGTGLSRGLTIADNMRLTYRLPFFLDHRASDLAATAAIEAFGIRARGPREVTARLSGGNVQKVLLSRELGSGATALIVASPTQGLDVAAIEFVHGLIDKQRTEGAAILLISEDLEEIRTLADRIVVMYAGRLVLERNAAESDLAELGLAMAGGGVR